MRKIVLLAAFVLSITANETFATHVVGGEMNYECLGNNQYRITLRVYRDCFNGVPALDNPASIGIFYSNGTLYQNLSVALNGPTNLVPTTPNPCTKIPNNVCVEVGVYTTTVTLPPTPGGYTLSYQRCCRNQTIVNLTNPGNQGATYTATIPDVSLATCNSNPVFSNWPPVFICVNTPLVYDHSATDKDGDVIVYELCEPYTGATGGTPRPSPPAGPPYNNVTWQSPYTAGNPMGGVPLTIDPNTGLLTGTPNTVGQFVVGVCAKEYRNGVLISTTKRDFQFNVIVCEKEVLALATGFTINCANHIVRFLNKSTGAVQYWWNFGDPTKTNDTSIYKDPVYQYPDTGTYTVRMIGYATNPLCNDTITLTIKIVPCYPCGMTVNVATTDAACGAVASCDTTAPPSSVCSGNVLPLPGNMKNVWTDTIVFNGACAAVRCTTTQQQCSAWSASGGSTNCKVTCDNKPVPVAGVSTCDTTWLGGGSLGTATLTVTSLNTPYTYYWDHDPFLTGPNAFGLSAGSYTVNILDAKGCVETKIFNINSTSPITLGTTKNNVSACGLKDGSITVTPSNGTAPPYTYMWSTGQTSSSITGLSAGNYTVTVMDQDSCPKYEVITITSPNVLNINAAPILNASCAGSTDGSATVTITGGAPPYTYSWNTSPTQTTPNATGLGARWYVVVVTDATGCSNADTIEIKENPPLVLTTSKTNLVCYQVNIGTATVSPTGGTSPYTFQWSPSGGNNSSANNLSAGTYTVTVTDNKGCTSTSTTLVTEPAPIDAEIIDKSSITCSGTFTGTLEVLVSGGSPGFQYLWNPGGTTSPILNGLAPGTSYTVTITDANGCSDTASYKLPTPGVMIVTITGVDESCKNLNNGSISVFPNGGNGPYQYLWNNSAPTQSIGGLSPGTYLVTVTDAQGCTATESYTLNPSAKEPPVATLTVPDSLCQNEKGQVIYTGTTPPGITYYWYFSGGTPGTGSTAGPHSVSWTEGGIKNITVIATVAGCSSDTAVLPVYIKKCLRRVPNIMNNDPGGNDKFWVAGLENWPGTRLLIYNRWGLKIYEDDDYSNDWYGKNMRGANVSDGVYYYILSYTDGTTDHGFVTIMRNQSNSRPMSEWSK